MADYISREAAIGYFRKQAKDMQNEFEMYGGEFGIAADIFHDVVDDLKEFDAADVEPVVHVRRKAWNIDEYYGEWLRCPNCGYTENTDSAKYCGGCGAKMDLEDENEVD